MRKSSNPRSLSLRTCGRDMPSSTAASVGVTSVSPGATTISSPRARASTKREINSAVSRGRSGGQVHVDLSRETAELISRLVDARARGEEIVVAPGDTEVTPTEAAVLLGMSRPQVRKLMDRGLLDFRMVGTHHRIRVSSIVAFRDTERLRRQK